MNNPLAHMLQPSREGIDHIIRGKTRKTCFGDNKHRPGKNSRLQKELLSEIRATFFEAMKTKIGPEKAALLEKAIRLSK